MSPCVHTPGDASVDGLHPPAERGEFGSQQLPAPGAVPGAVDEQDDGIVVDCAGHAGRTFSKGTVRACGSTPVVARGRWCSGGEERGAHVSDMCGDTGSLVPLASLGSVNPGSPCSDVRRTCPGVHTSRLATTGSGRRSVADRNARRDWMGERRRGSTGGRPRAAGHARASLRRPDGGRSMGGRLPAASRGEVQRRSARELPAGGRGCAPADRVVGGRLLPADPETRFHAAQRAGGPGRGGRASVREGRRGGGPGGGR
ncbi:hypothetical protein BN159_0225 [Streptomyces davaonensis JCM 4913]|uniref:Uncharacterized protein n=1 Tax=Streptomyces davaonensis (strain DSM 101723 / JCM 4913 / KCC S-0913 / 768) TaxID=1214101 RepID=K4QW47_STRDJ|nr:hypothetical protein BN159_0225 [Streptomyces davaonensis JCM 4913]